MQPLPVGQSRPILIAFSILLSAAVSTAASNDSRGSSPRSSPVIERTEGTSAVDPPTPRPGSLDPSDGGRGIADDAPLRYPLGLDHYALGLVRRLHHDYRTQFQFPFRYAKQDPARFLLGVAGIASLTFTDHLTYKILAPRSSLEENGLIAPAARLSKWGNTSSAFPLVIGIGAVGLILKSPRERETSLMLVEALVTSATWTGLIKMIGGRERPREKEEEIADWEGPDIFNDDVRGEGLRSFPSGHASGIWSVATILANQYPKYGIVPILGYGTAVAMSYSRMAVGAHWLSDVVVGGLIGYGCAKQVLSANDSRGALARDPGFRFGIDVTGGYKGVSLRVDF